MTEAYSAPAVIDSSTIHGTRIELPDDPRILDCGHTEAQHGRMRCAQVRAIEARIAATPPTWRERLHRRWNQR